VCIAAANLSRPAQPGLAARSHVRAVKAAGLLLRGLPCTTHCGELAGLLVGARVTLALRRWQIFVGGISPAVGEDELRDYFSACAASP